VALSSEVLRARAAFLTSSRRVGILPPSLPMLRGVVMDWVLCKVIS